MSANKIKVKNVAETESPVEIEYRTVDEEGNIYVDGEIAQMEGFVAAETTWQDIKDACTADAVGKSLIPS